MEKITLLATIGQAGISMFIPTYSHLKQGKILFLATIAVRVVLCNFRMQALILCLDFRLFWLFYCEAHCIRRQEKIESRQNLFFMRHQYLTVFRDLFSDHTIAEHTFGQTFFVVRCDIPRAPMLKHPIKRCHLKKGILRIDCSPYIEWKLLTSPPPSCLVHQCHRPSLSATIAIAIATLGRAMPRRQLSGCIHQGKKSKMSIFRRCIGLSHLAVGFHHYLQCGLALVGSALHSAAQITSQIVVIHTTFHGAGQVVQAASMFTLICVHLARCVQSCSTFTRLYDHPSTRMPRQNLCLDSWTEQEAFGFTSFTKGQLSNIYHHFGLAARAAQNDGAILVPTNLLK